MDLKYLQTFQTIIEEGGFSRAAAKLNYTQSTITFQMGQLEQELSAKLFEKIGRRMVLTKAGEQLVPYVNEVLSSVDKLRFFETELADCQGDLRIGAAETYLCYRLPEMIGAFTRRAPRARLFLQSMNCYVIRDALLDGSLDLGIFYEEIKGFGSSLTTYPLGTYPVVLVASPQVRERFPDFITADQELPVPLIINEKNCIFRQIFERYLREQDIRIGHTVELGSIPTIKNLVMNGLGITFLPIFTVQPELDSGRLVAIPTAVDLPELHAVVAHHHNKWVSPLMRLFIEMAEAAAEQSEV